jgi:hypothetical protein
VFNSLGRRQGLVADSSGFHLDVAVTCSYNILLKRIKSLGFKIDLWAPKYM